MTTIGSWGVFCSSEALMTFSTAREAHDHAAQLSMALGGRELIVAWIAGVVSLRMPETDTQLEGLDLADRRRTKERKVFLRGEAAA